MHDQWFKDIEINGLLEKQCKSSIIQSKAKEYRYKSLAKVTKKYLLFACKHLLVVRVVIIL